jgi:regulator of RNase E activity RraA
MQQVCSVRYKDIATATWADALDSIGIHGVIGGIPMRTGHGRIVGRARTVREIAVSEGVFSLADFAVGRIIDAITPGSVPVIAAGGVSISTCGGLAARAIKLANAAGIIIDGGCRDIEEIASNGLWLAARHVTPLTGKRRLKVESIGEPIEIDGVTICQNDIVIGDATGIVVVPAGRWCEVALEAVRLHGIDRAIDRELLAGRNFNSTTSVAGYM